MAEFYSHAIDINGKRKGTKLLKEHLGETGRAIKKIVIRSTLNDCNFLSDVGYLIGIAHDFGKYTSYFQKYLLSGKKGDLNSHHHGLASALFSAYLVGKFIGDKSEYHYLKLIAYFVILHHHGDLKALELDVPKYKDIEDNEFLHVDNSLRSRLKAFVLQLKDLSKSLSSIEREYKNLYSGELPIGEFLDGWREIFREMNRLRYRLFEHESERTREKLFIQTLFLYSALIDADKKEAADVREIKRKDIPSNLVDRFREDSRDIDTTAKEGMNGLRNEIYAKATTNITKVPLDNHIFTIISPTGTGKTLTSFSCALKLRQRLQEKGYKPRIIYSLPFTSVVDQNYEVIRNVLKQIPDFEKDESAYLVKHHHLADLKYKEGDEERPLDESLLLVESWESEVIVTTFIQLLHTVVGFKNRFLKKYHNIAGAIILLDEVQNIPVEYWKLTKKMLRLITDELGCYIILLTATKPLIFDEKETIPLVEDSERYFKQMKRVSLIPDMSGIDIEDLYERFNSLYEKSYSYLIVLNTIRSSIEFYEMLKKDDRFKSLLKEGKIFYLSTNIIPRERGTRIRRIRDLSKRKEKFIVVSTQVIEAGVDIDMDIVIRDLGPVDSIIQVAGRCNRSMHKDSGKVYVFHLKDEYNSLAKYVYGPVHCTVAQEIIGGEVLNESNFFDLINRYFTKVSIVKNQDESKKIWDAVRQFRFHHPYLKGNDKIKSISDFELIKEKNGYIDVFIEVDEKARLTWDQYTVKVVKEQAIRKRHINHLSLRKDFNSYIISVPSRLKAGLNMINEYLYHVPRNQLDVYYENDTGYKRTESADFIF